MATYSIRYTETVETIFYVEADTPEEAYCRLCELDSDNHDEIDRYDLEEVEGSFCNEETGDYIDIPSDADIKLFEAHYEGHMEFLRTQKDLFEKKTLWERQKESLKHASKVIQNLSRGD